MFDPYNLYFTPDGTRAIAVAERMNTLFVYDPQKVRNLYPNMWNFRRLERVEVRH